MDVIKTATTTVARWFDISARCFFPSSSFCFPKKRDEKNNVKAFPTSHSIKYCLCAFHSRLLNLSMCARSRSKSNYEHHHRTYEIIESDRRDVKVIEDWREEKKHIYYTPAESHWWKFIWPCTRNEQRKKMQSRHIMCGNYIHNPHVWMIGWSLYDLCFEISTFAYVQILQPSKIAKVCPQKIAHRML